MRSEREKDGAIGEDSEKHKSLSEEEKREEDMV
jgi:hypothetical protein